jgi:tRNA (guanine-N7-)-methyltransferase
MEIRTAVAAYVNDRILATRQAQSHLEASNKKSVEGGYQNVSVIRANSMKHMPNFFSKGQVRPSHNDLEKGLMGS